MQKTKGGLVVEAGTVLLEKYRIERVIGEGGMGVVARAHHLTLDQPVAIKFLLDEVLGNQEVVQRFMREAQAAVKLRSEHVARVHDVGTLASGAPYMVMELLDGVDLGGLLRQRGALVPGLAVDFMLQACEALAEAHALGFVHRDIKPANFFITRRASGAPLLKVLDFGISKIPAISAALDARVTQTQAVLGTPAYMSPEQMRSSKHVDARTDIWAMGVVLYEALAGRRPFSGETFSALCIQVASDPMPPFPVPLPPGLISLVARCLEKDPDMRFQNMAELAAALAPFAGTPAQAASSVERTAGVLGLVASASGAVSSARAGGAVHALPTTMRASAGQVSAAPGRGWRVGIIAAAAGVTALLAVLALGIGSDGGASGARPGVLAPGAAPAATTATVPAEIPAAPSDDETAASHIAGLPVPDAGVPAVPEADAAPDAAPSDRARRKSSSRRRPKRGDHEGIFESRK